MGDGDAMARWRDGLRFSPYIVSAAIGFVLVAVLMWGNSQDAAEKKATGPAKESRADSPAPSQPMEERGLESGGRQIDPETKIREIIERTKGDYAKLTEEEKFRLNDFTMGHGRQYFDSRVLQWKRKVSPGKL